MEKIQLKDFLFSCPSFGLKKSFKVIYSENPCESKDFYSKLFDFEVAYENSLLIHLSCKSQSINLGIIKIKQGIIPEFFCNYPQDCYLQFHSAIIDELFEVAIKSDLNILQEPHATYCGRRRFLLKDPDGTFVDVFSGSHLF